MTNRRCLLNFQVEITKTYRFTKRADWQQCSRRCFYIARANLKAEAEKIQKTEKDAAMAELERTVERLFNEKTEAQTEFHELKGENKVMRQEKDAANEAVAELELNRPKRPTS